MMTMFADDAVKYLLGVARKVVVVEEARRAERRVEEDLRWGRGDMMAGYSKACAILSAGRAVSARQDRERCLRDFVLPFEMRHAA